MKSRCSTKGFTLVELLVVIAIIGVLIALLLPAIQAAREAARRMECANHIKQICLAMANFESAHKHYPSGGWGYTWGPHPGRGVEVDQPGSWAYVLLPYLELDSLRRVGDSCDPKADTSANQLAMKEVYETACNVWSCPTRRPSEPYPMASTIWFVNTPRLCAKLDKIGLADYAANGGDGRSASTWKDGPSTLAQGDLPKGAPGAYVWPHDTVPRPIFTGVISAHEYISIGDIVDGTSSTYMMGEKWVWPGEYHQAGPKDVGDDQGIYTSDERDTVRYALVSPRQEKQGEPYNDGYTWNFGSTHAGGANMGMCDGSVRMIGYDVDLVRVHKRLANREDGGVVDPR